MDQNLPKNNIVRYVNSKKILPEKASRTDN